MKKEPKIKDSKIGSLKAIAKKDGGIKSNGEISKVWAKGKMKNPKTKPSTKKKINFFLNFNK